MTYYRCECWAKVEHPAHAHKSRCRKHARVRVRKQKSAGGWYRYCRECGEAIMANPFSDPLEWKEGVDG